MLRIGLTGGIACGKSTAASYFTSFGASVLDADQIAKEVVEPFTPGWQAIVSRFGENILESNFQLNRKRLGQIVFADSAALNELNQIVHPLVFSRLTELERQARQAGVKVLIHMIPLLAETRQDGFDAVVVVDMPPNVQLDRLCLRDHLNLAEAKARIHAQSDRRIRLQIADIVVDNSGDLPALARHCAAAWDRLQIMCAQAG